MPKVYVFASMMPMGGAYMAYHVGRMLHVHFGYEFVDVDLKNYEKQVFEYDIPVTTIGVTDMEKNITAEDLLIVNPAYSHVFFGLRLPGRKIMYIQDFKTFKILDCHFDLYVSVSMLVSRYVQSVYGITTPVIPAFIELDRMPAVRPWHERPAGSALVYQKHHNTEHTIIYDYLTKVLKAHAPEIDLSRVVKGREMSHEQFLQALGEVRYLVNLSISEGFGLVPLEAMALGTMVTGLDSLGSVDYMRSGENCLVSSAKDMRTLPDTVRQAFANEALASRCAQNGITTAQAYGYEPFKAAWLQQLSALLGRASSHG